jgi:hypothetical protein
MRGFKVPAFVAKGTFTNVAEKQVWQILIAALTNGEIEICHAHYQSTRTKAYGKDLGCKQLEITIHVRKFKEYCTLGTPTRNLGYVMSTPYRHLP